MRGDGGSNGFFSQGLPPKLTLDESLHVQKTHLMLRIVCQLQMTLKKTHPKSYLPLLFPALAERVSPSISTFLKKVWLK